MTRLACSVFRLAFAATFASAAFAPNVGTVTPPDTIVLDGAPPVSEDLKRDLGRYLEFRSAAFSCWHPEKREILIATRFADTPQIHHVAFPGGARRQLTFGAEPISGASFNPRNADYFIYGQDVGGGEFYQIYRYDLTDGRSTLLTDGKSRNMGARWTRSGNWLAYTSTRRNGRDNDVYVMNPADPKTDRLVAEVTGGGWSIQDWSPDETQLLLEESISANKSHLHLLDLKTGARRQITPQTKDDVAYPAARFAHDGKTVLVTTDRDSEFQRLVEYELPGDGRTIDQARRVLSGKINWDVENFELTEDGRTLALVANENGVGRLHLLEMKTGKVLRIPQLPLGVISGIRWHRNGRDLAFNLSSAKSPADVYSLDAKTGKLDRWTQSEAGGLDTSKFAEPVVVEFKSFDGLKVSALVYRPDPVKFPGKRPVLVNIHGGPEGQSRPLFQARNNYYLNELGVALVFPNVRGSTGYGKTYLALDNGFKREDSVRDVGALLAWIKAQDGFDAARIGVIGGSYGGYMVLASMVHYSDQLKCGVDVVGISNFLSFLKNTQDYRRDLRRVEYGDERDPAMAEFLQKISPTSNVQKITKPLLVAQGKNDPRVPVTEAEQMVKAIRENRGQAWYLMATDEGHGFAKKKNADFNFLVTIQFLKENLIR